MASTFIIPQAKYDVFLSFRGKDTRNNFTSHLRAALSRKNIGTFIDYQLIRGGEISASLLNAIESSKISIVILSEGYTSSRWCLQELTKILQCKKMFGQIVMPVFYHIHPSDVRSQTRNWGEAFAKHEENFQDKVFEWRDALAEVANLAGWHLDANKLESTFVEQIADDVLKRLNLMSPSKNKHLVGAHSRMEKIKSLLHLGSKNVFIVGIWGIGGMGKTTLVHAVFNEISSQFDNSHFCYVGEESKKYGLIRLQQKFLSRILEDKHGNLECGFSKDWLCRKKVFIVFDDVISAQQIEIFITNLECFGLGSRVIITTRDKQVLRNCGINDDNMYEIQGLYGDEALQLFSQHALKEKVPRADFAKLSIKLVEYTKGLPLALKVLGSSLFGKGEEYWESQLNKLGIAPHQDIREVLKLSYDRLDVNQRSIFLDIACFFNGRKRDVVTKILEGCGHIFPKSEISVLVDKCLITTVDDQKIIMHDLLQEMSKEIIRQESINNPGKRSRLWHHNDIHSILTKNLGTEAIQGIQLDMSKTKEMNLNCHSFAKMCNLRFFDFCCSSSADLELNYSESFFYCSCNKENFNRVHASERLKFPSTDLAYFRWHGYPWKSLPSRFHSSNLVALIMPHSKLKKLWRGIQDLDNLKHINLSYSEHLTKIPNLSLAPNLESLILQSCTSLIDICSSIQNLDKLATLNLRDCKSLSNLPSSIHSKSLHAVYVSGCSNLKTAPTFPCEVRFLDLEGTAIRVFPLVEHPSRLIELNLNNCARLQSRVLTSLLCLSSLKFLSLGNCGITELPNNLGQLYSLEKLYLYGNYFASLPPSIKELSNLYYLDLGGCEKLQYLPTTPMGIQINACNGRFIRFCTYVFE